MLEEIKRELIGNPEKIKDVLEQYDFANVVIHGNYISFGRSTDSSPKSIVLWLKDNDFLAVNDFAMNIRKDLFSFIMLQRRVGFKDVLATVRQVLGIEDFYLKYEKPQGIFGGFYNRIKKQNCSYNIKIYDDSVLSNFIKSGNIRFLKDNISLATQRYFDIRYDVESQGIIIPIYTQLGQLMGAKVRCNYDVEDGDMKYWYEIPCSISQTLYGYSQNYQFLNSGTVYILEAEKSVMQAYTYGIRNCVSLGSGSISLKQCRMIHELNPEKVVFLHDVGYEKDRIERNIEMVKRYSRFSEVQVGYWNYFDKDYPDKASPSDLGATAFKRILDEDIDFEL